jgi:hypothetical protein
MTDAETADVLSTALGVALPLSLYPQHSARPPSLGSRTPHAYLLPQLSDSNRCCWLTLLMSCPNALSPQHWTKPSDCSAQPKSVPTQTDLGRSERRRGGELGEGGRGGEEGCQLYAPSVYVGHDVTFGPMVCPFPEGPQHTVLEEVVEEEGGGEVRRRRRRRSESRALVPPTNDKLRANATHRRCRSSTRTSGVSKQSRCTPSP